MMNEKKSNCHWLFLTSLGFESGDIECNGWQWDYWIDYTKGNAAFTFSGSGYYGEQKFAVKEE